MIYTVIIILIVSLVLLVVIMNAFQQHKNKIETERKAELSKQKGIIDNTEAVLISADQIPISQRIVFVMRQRILAAIKVAKSMGDKTIGSNASVKMAEDSLKAIDVNIKVFFCIKEVLNTY